MAVLLHGTTKFRAEQIEANGPDPNFIEPNGLLRAENFSTYLESGPFHFGGPEAYARRKALLFPNEGGPAILAIDVPDDIIELAEDNEFPLSQGVVQFDPSSGLNELRAAWPSLSKRIEEIDP